MIIAHFIVSHNNNLHNVNFSVNSQYRTKQKRGKNHCMPQFDPFLDNCLPAVSKGLNLKSGYQIKEKKILRNFLSLGISENFLLIKS